MAVGTATAIIGGAQALSSGFQLFNGMKETRQATNDLENFERQDLDNVYQDMQISTLGSDLMREESGRTTAGLVDASMNGGIRGVLGALPKIQAQNNTQNRESQVYLDKQVQDRNRLIANDNARIQSMQEQRDNQELAGIGARLQSGKENTFNGIRGVANTASFVGSNLENSTLPSEDRQALSQIPNALGSSYSAGFGNSGSSFSPMPNISYQGNSYQDYLNNQRSQQQNANLYPNSNGLV